MAKAWPATAFQPAHEKQTAGLTADPDYIPFGFKTNAFERRKVSWICAQRALTQGFVGIVMSSSSQIFTAFLLGTKHQANSKKKLMNKSQPLSMSM